MRNLQKYYYFHIECIVLTLYLCDYVRLVCCWNADIKPNSFSIVQHNDADILKFSPHSDDNAHDVFKILRIETDHVIIGAKNRAYNISLNTLEEVKDGRVSWSPEESDKQYCVQSNRPETCENFIRLFVPVGNDTAYVCGTYAFERKCATYNFTDDTLTNIKSVYILPHDPNAEYTVTYSDGYIFSNANLTKNRYPNIFRTNHINSDTIMTTGVKSDRAVLNNPRFVKSFSYNDKIYFFFREFDYKGINRFSSVARVCKSDSGGKPFFFSQKDNIFTSYFKSRIECSRRGVLPFYFDEIAAASDVGQSNFTSNNLVEKYALYAVFNTPTHAISASAVCLYQMLDIAESFEGNFKNNTVDECDMSEIPPPKGKRLYECTNKSSNIQPKTVTFIRGFPIMARTVQANGDDPVLIITGVNYRLSSVAVDWRVLASDDRYYDVIFVGTDNGHLLKIMNHESSNMSVGENNLIEKLLVFRDNRAITRLHVRRQEDVDAKLIIESYNQILSVPLQRCHLRTTCSSCVALRDPYCSWVDAKGCVVAEANEHSKALQDIQTGIHILCVDDIHSSSHQPIRSSVTQPSTMSTRSDCCAFCPTHAAKDAKSVAPESTTTERSTTERSTTERSTTEGTTTGPQFSAQTLVISNVLSVLIAGFVAFAFGYCCHMRRTRKKEIVIKKPEPLTSFSDEGLDTILSMRHGDSSQFSFKSRLQSRSKKKSAATLESTGGNDRTTISQRLTDSSHSTHPPSSFGSLEHSSQVSPQPIFQSSLDGDIKTRSLRKRADSDYSRRSSKLNLKSSSKRRDIDTSVSTKPTKSSRRTHPPSAKSSFIGNRESSHRVSSKSSKRRDIDTSVSVKPTNSSRRGNKSMPSAQRSYRTNARANSTERDIHIDISLKPIGSSQLMANQPSDKSCYIPTPNAQSPPQGRDIKTSSKPKRTKDSKRKSPTSSRKVKPDLTEKESKTIPSLENEKVAVEGAASAQETAPVKSMINI